MVIFASSGGKPLGGSSSCSKGWDNQYLGPTSNPSRTPRLGNSVPGDPEYSWSSAETVYKFLPFAHCCIKLLIKLQLTFALNHFFLRLYLKVLNWFRGFWDFLGRTLKICFWLAKSVMLYFIHYWEGVTGLGRTAPHTGQFFPQEEKATRCLQFYHGIVGSSQFYFGDIK